MRQARIFLYFWPDELPGDLLTTAKIRALSLFCFLAALFGSIFGVYQITTSAIALSIPQLAMLILSAPLYALLPALFRTRLSVNVSSVIIFAVSYALILIESLLYGGLTSPSTMYMISLGCVIALIFGVRGALAAVALTLSHLIGMNMLAPWIPPVVDFSEPGIAENFVVEAVLFSLVFTALNIAVFQMQLNKASLRLAAALDAAKAADRSKSEFLANMSHEIRTPMNGVLGMAELIQQTELDDKQKMFAKTIYSSGSALLTIINDILDFSKIEAGKLELDPVPFNLQQAVEDVAILLGVGAREKGIELMVRIRPDVPDMIVGDAGRIRQVLTNIVGNAVKFTNEGSVLIDVGCVEDDGVNARLSIEITDTGIGIPADKLDLIFEKFTQAESSTTRKFGGTGLGLSIKRSLIEVMGGTINVASTYGKGTSFKISLTVPVSESRAGASTQLYHFESQRILIVDDNPVNRSILEENLRLWSATAINAENGRVGLERLRAAAAAGDPIPIVLVDYHMPEMDGLEFVRAIRDDETIADTQIIVLSSVDDDNVMREFRNLGVVDVMPKPVRMTLLRRSIGLALAPEEADAKKVDAVTSPDVAQEDQDPDRDETGTDDRSSILIAEDNPVNRMVIEHMIDKTAHRLTFAENGQLALDAAMAEKFDLVLMDISLPVMDGETAAAAIRAHEDESGKPHTPIVVLTAHAMAGDRERFLATNFDDYLAKPVKKEHIDTIIEKWLTPDETMKLAANAS